MVQFIQILQRINVKQMGNLKYLSNFGLSLENISTVKNSVFVNFSGLEVQRPFASFESSQLVKLFSYSFMSMLLLYERSIEEESKFLCVNAYHNIVKHNLEYHRLYDFTKE